MMQSDFQFGRHLSPELGSQTLSAILSGFTQTCYDLLGSRVELSLVEMGPIERITPAFPLIGMLEFSGWVTGFYAISLDHELWSSITEGKLSETDSLELFKEVINSTSTPVFTVLREDFSMITRMAPKVIEGKVHFPKMDCMRALARGPKGELELYIAMDSMQTDLHRLALALQDKEEALVETVNSLQIARDAAEDANRAKSDFLSLMSHEIRTPLNGILGMNQLLMDSGLDGDKKEYSTIIRTCGEQLLTVVNDILDYFKIEAGKLTLEQIDFNLKRVIADVSQLYTNLARSHGLGFSWNLEEGFPSFVNGDPTRIRQILVNLLSNALKFTKQGGITILGKHLILPNEDIEICLEVRDSGMGLTAAQIERLFNPFSQADTSTSRKYGGTGLGLAICKSLTEKMNGIIGVESELDVGSKFWFTARFSRAVGPETSQIESVSTAESSYFGKESDPACHTILVVEDNVVNQKVARSLLSNMGFIVDLASNGLEALKYVESKPYSLVLMDCQMPEMDGYEATGEIRKLSGDISRIPIIAMTAHAILGEKERCMAAGMDDYLCKPVSKNKLREKLMEWLPALPKEK